MMGWMVFVYPSKTQVWSLTPQIPYQAFISTNWLAETFFQTCETTAVLKIRPAPIRVAKK
jgi:hypothetical protein